jgi:hypothetical protein
VSRTLLQSKLTVLVGSLLSAAAHTTSEFIVGRTIAGAGAAGIITGAMRIIAIAAPRKHRTFLEAAGAIVMGQSPRSYLWHISNSQGYTQEYPQCPGLSSEELLLIPLGGNGHSGSISQLPPFQCR